MKKNVYTAIAFAAVALFAACSSDDDMLTSVEENQGITIIANLPHDAITRVAYTETSAETSAGSTYGVKETWEENDELRCTYWQAGQTKQRSETNTVTFETGKVTIGKTPTANAYVYLSYPTGLSEPTVADAAGSTSTWAPTGQANYVFSTINEVAGKNLLVGSFQYTDNKTQTVTLQNVYALLKFSVKVPTTEASIKNITIGRLNDAKTARATINCRGDIVMTGSDISFSDYVTGAVQSSSSAIFSLTGDGTYKEVTFYALVIPQEFTNGLYLELKDAANATYKYLKAGTVTLEGVQRYGVKDKVAKV